MLSGRTPLAFIHVDDLDAARRFYLDVLGLEFREESQFALVVVAGPVEVRITPVEGFSPQPFAIFGWWVDDIGDVLDRLSERGVPAVRYDALDQDERGVWTAPGGARVAWLHDPAGNTLSLTEPPVA